MMRLVSSQKTPMTTLQKTWMEISLVKSFYFLQYSDFNSYLKLNLHDIYLRKTTTPKQNSLQNRCYIIVFIFIEKCHADYAEEIEKTEDGEQVMTCDCRGDDCSKC